MLALCGSQQACWLLCPQAGSINKSLLTLGAVIRALGSSGAADRSHRLSESSGTPIKDAEKVRCVGGAAGDRASSRSTHTAAAAHMHAPSTCGSVCLGDAM